MTDQQFKIHLESLEDLAHVILNRDNYHSGRRHADRIGRAASIWPPEKEEPDSPGAVDPNNREAQSPGAPETPKTPEPQNPGSF